MSFPSRVDSSCVEKPFIGDLKVEETLKEYEKQPVDALQKELKEQSLQELAKKLILSAPVASHSALPPGKVSTPREMSAKAGGPNVPAIPEDVEWEKPVLKPIQIFEKDVSPHQPKPPANSSDEEDLPVELRPSKKDWVNYDWRRSHDPRGTHRWKDVDGTLSARYRAGLELSVKWLSQIKISSEANYPDKTGD